MADEEVVEGNALQNENQVEVVEQPVEAVAEQVEQQEDTQPEPKTHGNKGRSPWYMERIHEETNKRRAIEQQLAQKEREAEEAKSLLERLQQPGDKAPQAKSEPQDIESLVEARASAKLLQKDSTDVRNAGMRAFSDFGDSLKVLTSVGATNDEFVQDLIDTDKGNAHKLIDFLAKDPDRALELVNMTSRRRVAELTRIAMKELEKPAAPAPKANVSRVPPPKPVIDAVSDDLGEVDLSNEKLSDEAWSKLFDSKFKKRA